MCLRYLFQTYSQFSQGTNEIVCIYRHYFLLYNKTKHNGLNMNADIVAFVPTNYLLKMYQRPEIKVEYVGLELFLFFVSFNMLILGHN